MLVEGRLNSFSSILASFTYWHDFPKSTILLSTFRDINLKPEKKRQTATIGNHLYHTKVTCYRKAVGYRGKRVPGVRGPGV